MGCGEGHWRHLEGVPGAVGDEHGLDDLGRVQRALLLVVGRLLLQRPPQPHHLRHLWNLRTACRSLVPMYSVRTPQGVLIDMTHPTSPKSIDCHYDLLQQGDIACTISCSMQERHIFHFLFLPRCHLSMDEDDVVRLEGLDEFAGLRKVGVRRKGDRVHLHAQRHLRSSLTRVE